MDYIDDIIGGFACLLCGLTGSNKDLEELTDLMESNLLTYRKDNREYFEKGYKIPYEQRKLKNLILEWQKRNYYAHSGMDIDKGFYNKMDALYLMCDRWLEMMDGYYPYIALQHTHIQDEQAIEPQQNQIIMEQQQKTTNTRGNRGRGRQKESFADKMIDGNKEKLDNIHKLMNGKKGKDAALIISACIIKGWITKPTHTQVKEEFGDIGTQQGFTKYLNNANTLYAPEEIGAILEQLKE